MFNEWDTRSLWFIKHQRVDHTLREQVPVLLRMYTKKPFMFCLHPVWVSVRFVCLKTPRKRNRLLKKKKLSFLLSWIDKWARDLVSQLERLFCCVSIIYCLLLASSFLISPCVLYIYTCLAGMVFFSFFLPIKYYLFLSEVTLLRKASLHSLFQWRGESQRNIYLKRLNDLFIVVIQFRKGFAFLH